MMITIELVLVEGVLIGKSFSDRWNLAQLGYGCGVQHSRNGAALKRLRREWAEDFVFRTIRNAGTANATRAELELIGATRRAA